MALVEKETMHISLSKAWEILKRKCRQLPGETVSVHESLGRTLAEDVTASRNVPHYNASAMDGYALSSVLTAGATPSSPVFLPSGEYEWVNTGSEVSPRFDSVVMIEDTTLDKTTGTLTVVSSLVAGENVRPLGEDVFLGQVIAREGDRVTPALCSLLATAGVKNLRTLALPKSLYIPTGDEIIPLEEWLDLENPPPGKVGESNSMLVKGYFRNWGFSVEIAPCIPDDPDILLTFLEEKRKTYDLILIGAGSAKGERDHTFSVLQSLGQPLFRWLLMKPGRPASVADLGGCLAVNLPGFPMSNAVILWSVVFPVLQLLHCGKFDEKTILPAAIGATGTEEVTLLSSYSSSYGKEEWVRFKCVEIDGEKKAYALPSGAGALWSLSETDGLSLLPLETAERSKGSTVNLWLLRDIRWKERILFQGSNDPAFERIATFVKKKGGEVIFRSVGSLGGLAALSRRECHTAACHLLDTETGDYNTSYIERMFGPQADALLARRPVFYRQQGIMVRKGNPKGIRSVSDLGREDVVMVNRQPGAGTRVLLDFLFRMENIDPGNVRGYENCSTTHFDAGNKVLRGFADAAAGIKSVADALGLDFLPLAEEPYELVYFRSMENHPGIAALLESLCDEGWRAMVDRMGGYRWPE
ncbi:substrate-binding domain-containing protein [Aminivibrio sp.]|uniref:substrate-binding domain-containing protein n=1 Tax=Aminivibrio sp. TaxID=1872489 RepID=UPI0025BEC56C|nr:substrate-binding domain-containing protein [Aminivibrio sp.]